MRATVLVVSDPFLAMVGHVEAVLPSDFVVLSSEYDKATETTRFVVESPRLDDARCPAEAAPLVGRFVRRGADDAVDATWEQGDRAVARLELRPVPIERRPRPLKMH